MQDEYTIPVCGLFIVWETSFPYDKNAPRGSHCSGMEECRLRDPPQAENPASQDSFLSYRKLRFYTIKTLREDAHSAQG